MSNFTIPTSFLLASGYQASGDVEPCLMYSNCCGWFYVISDLILCTCLCIVLCDLYYYYYDCSRLGTHAEPHKLANQKILLTAIFNLVLSYFSLLTFWSNFIFHHQGMETSTSVVPVSIFYQDSPNQYCWKNIKRVYYYSVELKVWMSTWGGGGPLTTK